METNQTANPYELGYKAWCEIEKETDWLDKGIPKKDVMDAWAKFWKNKDIVITLREVGGYEFGRSHKVAANYIDQSKGRGTEGHSSCRPGGIRNLRVEVWEDAE